MAVKTFGHKCEPLRSWNRLETRPRKKDFDNVLKAEIYDPLWMLARQWQFGEFKGEDTGSAIMAKVELKTTRLSKYQSNGQAAVAYVDSIPLETKVEALNIHFDYKTRVSTGNQWFKMLKSLNLLSTYKQVFISRYPVQLPEIVDEEPANSIIQKSQILSNHAVCQFVSATTGRSMDGIAFFEDIDKQNIILPANVQTEISNSHITDLNSLVQVFVRWVDELYFVPSAGQSESWNKKQLEYEFSCAVPDKPDDNTILRATEYYQGSLDWCSFDIDSKRGQNGLDDENPQAFLDNNFTRTLAVIPTEAQFGGMPNKRWWEFEDGHVDLGNITADEKNLCKILITEFALVYSNDWFVVPYQVPVGSLSEVTGIIVNDVFGQKTLIEAAGKGEIDNWNRWNMFNLTIMPQENETFGRIDNRIFIPPVIGKTQESKPVESVWFIRDEMANMVYGIEKQIDNMLGEGMSGHDASLNLVNYLTELYNHEALDDEELAGILHYQLGNTIPENWIPFIPVHLGENNRSIQLQRASMPRTIKGLYPDAPGPVRPRTAILRYGIDDEDQQEQPYYIFEEEVPRAGVQVTATFQRVRWYNGKIVTWFGRRKKTGRGEGSSGLMFDTISDLKNHDIV